MKKKEQFIIIPEEAWIKGIENKDYLACYCFIREHALMTNKVIFTKKVLYDQLRVKRQNIKERVCQAMVRPVPPPDATEKYFLPCSIHSFLYVPATGCWKRVGFVELPVMETPTFS